jgi:DNA-binding CsgD family transcriptional regulator
MSILVTSAIPTLSFATGNTASNVQAAQNQRQVQQTNTRPADTVQLTEVQQVYQLYNQGQRISQIASALDLSIESVNNYLGITTAAG